MDYGFLALKPGLDAFPRMKLAAAEAPGKIIKKPTIHKFVPSIFDASVVKNIESAVSEAVKGE